MASESEDQIHQEARAAAAAAVTFLIEVARGRRTVEDVRKWLQEEYPEMCEEKDGQIVW